MQLDGASVRWTASATDGSRRTVRLTRLRAGPWRLELSGPDGSFDGRGAAHLLARELSERLDLTETALTLTETGRGAWRAVAPEAPGSVEIGAQPIRLAFLAADGRPRAVIDRLKAARRDVRASGPLADGERLFGTGERFNALDQRGRRVLIWAEDRWCETEGNSYLPIPFILSTAGYALFVNRFEGMVLDLGREKPGRWEALLGETPLDLMVFVDDSPGAILGSLARVTGRPARPPAWAFGILVSRHLRTKEFSTAAGVREMARRMDAADLPWTGVILEGWPTYDTATYADLKALVDEFHARGKKVLVYQACGRLDRSLWSKHGGRPEYFVRSADGNPELLEAGAFNPADAPHLRRSTFLDVTNPEALAWWAGRVWRRLLEEVGVDGAKIDFCEQFPEMAGLVMADPVCGSAARGMHHLHPVLYNATMYRLFQVRRPEGGLCWSRGGGIGAQRHPFLWCGDQLREFRFLKPILTAALSAGLSGIPFMGHDLAGYLPTKDPGGNPEAEVFIRGTQLAAFGPVMSTHGTVTRPYDFPAPVVDLYRLYSKAHLALGPYLVEQAGVSCETGLPLMRPLYLHAPQDERAREIDDEYLLGSELLVAPVLERTEARDVYLPGGAWRDLWTGDVFEGPKAIEGYSAPLRRIPVFAAEPAASAALAAALPELRRLLGDADKTA